MKVGNEIAIGAIVKPILCVHFLNTELEKSRVGLMEFKRRMGEVEKVLVTHNFDSAWVLISTSSMNPKTTCITQKGHTFVFFATKG